MESEGGFIDSQGNLRITLNSKSDSAGRPFKKDALATIDGITSTLRIGSTGTCIDDNQFYMTNDVNFFSNCGCAAGAATSTGGDAGILAFAKQPITSTWNISDSTVEQWFLSTGTWSVGHYGLNSGNIGSVTSVVKAAGVSPVFFYAYAVNEGGGAGGFINHYGESYYAGHGGDTAVNAATGDAQYLASQSKKMNSNPAWIDAKHPVDFVPQDIKTASNADFQSMPSGTIGRAYIPATAAATWEVYYPDGLKKTYNTVRDYGTPLQDIINRVKKMGGDPTQGGSDSATCADTSDDPPVASGDIAETATAMAEWGGTYAWGGGHDHGDMPSLKDTIAHKFQGGTKYITHNGIKSPKPNEYGVDCSGFVRAVIYVATGTDVGPITSSLGGRYLTQVSKESAQPGDLFHQNGHTGVIVKNNAASHTFSTAESAGTAVGQQLKTRSYSSIISVFRFNGGGTSAN